MNQLSRALFFALFLMQSEQVSAQTFKELTIKLDSLAKSAKIKLAFEAAPELIRAAEREFGDTSFQYTAALMRELQYVSYLQMFDGWEARLDGLKTQISRTVAPQKKIDFLWMRYYFAGGQFAFGLADYPKAQVWMEQYWLKTKEYYGELKPETIAAHQNFATTLIQQDKLREAKAILESSISEMERCENPNLNAIGITHRNLGAIDFAVGNIHGGQAHHKKAAEIQAGQGRRGEELIDLKNLARGYDLSGENFAEVQKLHKTILAGLRAEFGENTLMFASMASRDGDFLSRHGFLGAAKKQYELAASIFENQPASTLLANEHVEFLSAYQQFLSKNGEQKAAIGLLEKELPLRKQRPGGRSGETLFCMARLSNAYFKNGQVAASDDLLKLMEAGLNLDSMRFSESYPIEYNLFEAHFLRKNLEKAEMHLDRFGASTQKSFGEKSSYWNDFLRKKAALKKEMGDEPQFLNLMNELGNSLQQRQQAEILSCTEAERNEIVKDWGAYINELVVSKNQPIGQKIPISTIYGQVLMKKAALANLNARLKSSILESGDPAATLLFEQWKAAKEQLAHLRTQPAETVKTYGYDLDTLKAEADRLERKLAASSVFFKNLKPLAQPDWREIQRNLPENSAAVDIVRLEKPAAGKQKPAKIEYAVFILKPDGKEPELLFLENGDELNFLLFEEYLTEIRAGKVPSKAVYDGFWGQIAPKLVGAKTVFIAPDGIFHKINLGSLQRPDGRFLSEIHQFKNLQSVAELLATPDENRPTDAPKTAVLLGNPRFDLAENSRGGTNKPGNWRGILDDAFFRLTPLPESEKEVRNISNLLIINGFRAEILLDTAATEVVLKTKKSPTVLHLATHGHFLKSPKREKMLFDEQEANDNPMLRAMLFFSGAQNTLNEQGLPESYGDGIFTAYEAANLSLEKTELVVLSACESGLGTIENGEGVFGLQRAFRFAGARFVLMSLWEVEDAASQQFMTLFYKNWMGGKPIPDAFDAAQTEMRLLHFSPMDWGGWVLLGN